MLETHLKLPLDVFKNAVFLHDLALAFTESKHNAIVFDLLFSKVLDFLTGLLQGLNDLLIGLFLVELLLLLAGVLFAGV